MTARTAGSTRDSRSPRHRLAHWAVGRAYGHRDDISGEPLPTRGIHRILVVKVCHTLGNALLLTPLLQELAVRFPGAEVDIVTRNPVARALFSSHPNVRHILQVPRHALAHPLSTWATLRQIRSAGYDLAIDADKRSHTGRLLTNYVGARHTVGFLSSKQRGHVTHPVPLPDNRPRESLLPVYLLRQAIGDGHTIHWPAPSLLLDRGERQAGHLQLERLLDPAPVAGTEPPPLRRPVIGVFANATGHKLIGGDWWARFLAVLAPACSNHDIVEIVPAFGRSMLGDRYPTYFSTDIRRLAGVLSALSVYVSADCGIMHLANASAPRSIGLFDGTDPADWGVFGPGHHNVRHGGRDPEDVAREVAALITAPGTSAQPGRSRGQ